MKNYLIDIDGTICSKLCELDGADYLNAEPLQDRIKKANELYQEGHTIIYQTARGMGRHNNNPILAIQDFYDLTKKQLEGWGSSIIIFFLANHLAIYTWTIRG